VEGKMNRMLIMAATVAMLAAAPASAQTSGPGGSASGYYPQYNGPGWLDAHRPGGAAGAQGQSRRGARQARTPGDIGPNPILPGRW
jgi:hypothetical protein